MRFQAESCIMLIGLHGGWYGLLPLEAPIAAATKFQMAEIANSQVLLCIDLAVQF